MYGTLVGSRPFNPLGSVSVHSVMVIVIKLIPTGGDSSPFVWSISNSRIPARVANVSCH